MTVTLRINTHYRNQRLNANSENGENGFADFEISSMI